MSKRFSNAMTATALIALLLTTASPSAWAVGGAKPAPLTPITDELAQAYQVESEGLTPIPVESAQRRSTPAPSCSASKVKGSYDCIEVQRGAEGVSVDALRESSAQYATAAATTVQPPPTWCLDALNQGTHATRLATCETFSFDVRKTQITNGVTTVLGTATVRVTSYQYMSYSLASFAHQLEFSTATTTGDVTGVTVSASSVCTGACGTGTPGYISPRTLIPGVFNSGESFRDPASVAIGAENFLATDWNITVGAAGKAPIRLAGNPFDLRCDNNAGGSSPVPGCVVYWVPGRVVYNNSNNPALVSHIARAQASGLLGGTSARPLHRTTVASVIAANRKAACGKPPTITGLTCDEYPFASSYEGGASGGAARTFQGCSFTDPAATGSVGFSRCMIPVSQNSSGGAILGNTYRQQRILEADPFYVSFNP